MLLSIAVCNYELTYAQHAQNQNIGTPKQNIFKFILFYEFLANEYEKLEDTKEVIRAGNRRRIDNVVTKRKRGKKRTNNETKH